MKSWTVFTNKALKRTCKVLRRTTAGASGRKKTIDILDGAYKVTFSIKAYKGFLDRAIERRGIEPDVHVRQKASDLSNGIDTTMTAALRYLSSAKDSVNP